MKDYKDVEKMIPKGPYCYGSNGILCPFWRKIDNKPDQLNGYCTLLKVGDWMPDASGELWDQVKECGINEGWDD
jgi:hypothetical protein